MEGSKFQGDLADVVRASGGCVAVRDMDDVSSVPLNINNEVFGDPFSSIRDPLEDPLVGIGDADFLLDETTSALVIPPAFQNISTSISICISDDQMRINGFQGPPSVVCVDPLMSTPISPTTTAARPQISSPSRNPIIKRRKSQAKKVVCIPAPTAANSRQGGGEVVPSDLWAWRKYGQKPIKGSPFPRGYYRCSSSKGCSARKQVERSRTDPNMLVITYTSEHNHPWPTQRNALAGSSRISPNSATSNNTKTNVKEEVEDPQNHIVSNGALRNDVGKEVVPNQLLMNDLVIDYDKSYRPVMQEEASASCGLGGDHDFFADLRELEADDLLFSRGSGSKSVLDVDPFGCLFDWPTSNSTTTNSDNTNIHQNS